MSTTAATAVQTGWARAVAARLAARWSTWRAAVWRDVAERALLAERAQLPLWAPVLLGCGIAAWFLLPWSEQRLAVAAAAAAVAVAGLAALAAAGTLARVLIWAGVLMLGGLGVAEWRSAEVAAPVLDAKFTGDLAGVIDAVEWRSGRGQVRLLLRPDDPALPRRVRISLKNSATSVPPPGLVPGARVALRAALNPPAGPAYPGGYDFARRAWFEGLGATGYPLGPVTVTAAAAPQRGIAAWLATLRTRLNARIEGAVPGAAGAVSAAFVTGDQGAIPLDVNLAMRNSGLAHLLSISGVHIAIVVGGTMWGVRRLLALSPWLALRWPLKAIAAAAAALAGIAYTLLAGGEVPTVRTCIATLIVLLGIALGREALSLRMIAAGAFLILCIRPEALLGPSFQLSFAAVTGLVALYQSPVGRWLSAPRPDSGWLAKGARHLLALLVTGVVAEAMLSATALFHFNQTGVYGVLANLVAIPLTSFVIMPLLLLALALDTVGLAAPIYWLLGQAMGALIALAEQVASWPGSLMRLPLMPPLGYGLLVGGGLWLCLWQTRLRWAGVLPIVVGAALALTARSPDLLVSADGRHAALLIGAGEPGAGRVAVLRERAGDYVRDMWGDATAAPADAWLADTAHADCSVDACVATIARGDERWRLLATVSRERVPRKRFAPACAAADIVVSDRRLPGWCTPRWLKLDRASLGASGAVAVWLAERRVERVAAALGDHAWLPKPAPYVPRRAYPYRRSSPASLP